MLSILGAMAEFERALIRERTMSGLAAARAEGRTGGNRGLVSGDRAMLSRLRLARRDAFLEHLNRSAGDWVPDVRRLRPDTPWQHVLAVVNSRLPDSRRWTLQRLVRAARACVAEGLLPESVLERATARRKDSVWHCCKKCGAAALSSNSFSCCTSCDCQTKLTRAFSLGHGVSIEPRMHATSISRKVTWHDMVPRHVHSWRRSHDP